MNGNSLRSGGIQYWKTNRTTWNYLKVKIICVILLPATRVNCILVNFHFNCLHGWENLEHLIYVTCCLVGSCSANIIETFRTVLGIVVMVIYSLFVFLIETSGLLHMAEINWVIFYFLLYFSIFFFHVLVTILLNETKGKSVPLSMRCNHDVRVIFRSRTL